MAIQKTSAKSEKVIENLLKNRGFNKHKVIQEAKSDVLVAFGHKEHNHSELIKHNYSSKTNELLIADGELSFDEFVVKANEYLKKK